MHEDELTIPDDVVRALLATQFPQWRHLPLRRIASSGTVNAIFRIGGGLAARFPLRAGDPDRTRDVLRREAEASAALAQHATVPTPSPVALGEPGPGYPLPFSVQIWVPGTVAIHAGPGGSFEVAQDLAAFVAGLRAADTGGRTFDGDNRGGDLRAHDEWVETCLRNSTGLLDVTRLRALWRRYRDLPREASDVMSHGDLIPGNVLLDGGRLAGVLDCGGFGPADPALDVIAGWHLLDADPRAAFRAALGCDELEWERSKAWAFEQSLGAVWYYARSNPAMSAMGRRTLRRILDDEATP